MNNEEPKRSKEQLQEMVDIYRKASLETYNNMIEEHIKKGGYGFMGHYDGCAIYEENDCSCGVNEKMEKAKNQAPKVPKFSEMKRSSN